MDMKEFMSEIVRIRYADFGLDVKDPVECNRKEQLLQTQYLVSWAPARGLWDIDESTRIF